MDATNPGKKNAVSTTYAERARARVRALYASWVAEGAALPCDTTAPAPRARRAGSSTLRDSVTTSLVRSTILARAAAGDVGAIAACATFAL